MFLIIHKPVFSVPFSHPSPFYSISAHQQGYPTVHGRPAMTTAPNHPTFPVPAQKPFVFAGRPPHFNTAMGLAALVPPRKPAQSSGTCGSIRSLIIRAHQNILRRSYIHPRGRTSQPELTQAPARSCGGAKHGLRIRFGHPALSLSVPAVRLTSRIAAESLLRPSEARPARYCLCIEWKNIPPFSRAPP